ncbi:hypothetical protein OH76DRAFT_1131515 [Lentinus brumalis]|uniref:Uncharacterized protein n=1 Tax=Lentinus brumalis TaxID=2498619 RepID=A0A371CUH6_9APHY|nr:hypothetical protein OH76DRAFT_1131515 [Polyporus brumalis]
MAQCGRCQGCGRRARLCSLRGQQHSARCHLVHPASDGASPPSPFLSYHHHRSTRVYNSLPLSFLSCSSMSLSTDPRPSPFTVAEFSDLVSSAFNIHDADLTSGLRHPLLAFTPASPLSRSSTSDADRSFDDEDPLSSGFDGGPPSSGRKSRSRKVNALFHQVRTRASAFVLRSRAPSPSRSPSPSPAPFQPLLPPCISPTPSSSSLVRAFSPWSMADLTRDRPRTRAESLPRSLFTLSKRDESPPPPLPVRDSDSGTRSPTPVLRSFFDDSPARSRRAYSRPVTSTSASSSTVHTLSRVTTSSSTQSQIDALPSFFEDRGYRVAKPTVPSYCRPVTPSGAPQRPHTRLPPLRKSRSSGYGLLRRRSRSKSTICEPPVGLGYQDLALWNSHRTDDMPSPLTHPRDVPPVPHLGVVPALSELDDCEPPLPPPYVFERRGSATSTSTGSTRSTSSLSARLSNLVGLAFPSRMRDRGRSKLNLSIATTSSADSSPSTVSSHSIPSTPSSPTSAFSHAQPHVYAASADGHTQQNSSDESEEDAAAIGRVLTPEEDPFAKAEIAVALQGTPRPPTPPLSRTTSLQHSPPGLTATGTWNAGVDQLQGKKTRNSLPATPVSAAFTFPSSCSIYPDQSPQEYAYNGVPRSAMSTPMGHVPPSAWSPFTPPATPSDTAPPSTPPSSHTRSPRSPSSLTRSESHQSPRRSPRPKCLVFPLPPSGLPPPFPPPALPPPDRALPSLPSTPRTPPVPPKDRADRIARAHKSLPPSPHPSSGSPLSARSHGSVRQWKDPHGCSPGGWRDGQLRALAERHESAVVREVPTSLAEPWSGTVSSGDWPTRPETPMSARSVTRRSSVDSTCTVTASPSSSAMHDTTQEWRYECDTISIDGEALLEGDSCSMAGGSDTLSSIAPTSAEDAADVFWSPVTSTSVFYSARGSLESSRVSLESDDEHRAHSLDAHPAHAPAWRRGKSASAGACA